MNAPCCLGIEWQKILYEQTSSKVNKWTNSLHCTGLLRYFFYPKFPCICIAKLVSNALIKVLISLSNCRQPLSWNGSVFNFLKMPFKETRTEKSLIAVETYRFEAKLTWSWNTEFLLSIFMWRNSQVTFKNSWLVKEKNFTLDFRHRFLDLTWFLFFLASLVYLFVF